MLMYNNFMGIVLEEEQKGFTIIEVMLFLALSGFLLVGILAGTGSSIANQRYKDAVQDAADALRSAYAFVSDTQIETRSSDQSSCGGTVDANDGYDSDDMNANRGRTTCAVYGAVVMIDGNRIQTTTVVGRDYFDFIRTVDEASAGNKKMGALTINDDLNSVLNPSSDVELLKGLHVNNIAKQCGAIKNCNTILPAGGVKVQKLKWDTAFKFPRTADQEKTQVAKITLLIYRHPSNGSIRTLSMDRAIEYNGAVVDYTKTLTSLKEQGINKYFSTDALTQKNIFLCVDSGGAASYSDHRRIIEITKNAHSQTGVVLTNMDETVYYDSAKTQEVLCDDI